MRVISLQSGSNGNCIYVETAGVRLLFDAGLSGLQVKRRLALHGRDVMGVDAVVISHDHADHARNMGVLHRKFGLPVYVTTRTYEAAGRYRVGEIAGLRHFRSGETLRFDKVAVETIPTPHDGVDGVAFVIDDGRRRLGILTDLGHVFAGLDAVLQSLDAVLLESNYDPEMLSDGPYPEWLKDRIRGPGGHISNVEAAELLQATASGRLQWACLAHLSQDNNTPAVALRTHHRIVGRRLPLVVATRHEASDVLEV